MWVITQAVCRIWTIHPVFVQWCGAVLQSVAAGSEFRIPRFKFSWCALLTGLPQAPFMPGIDMHPGRTNHRQTALSAAVNQELLNYRNIIITFMWDSTDCIAWLLISSIWACICDLIPLINAHGEVFILQWFSLDFTESWNEKYIFKKWHWSSWTSSVTCIFQWWLKTAMKPNRKQKAKSNLNGH